MAKSDWIRGSTTFTITFSGAGSYLYYKKYSAEITNKRGATWRNDAVIDDDSGTFEHKRARCFSNRLPYFSFDYDEENVIESAQFEGGSSGPYIDPTGCWVSRTLMNLDIGDKLDMYIRPGQGTATSGTRAFWITSSEPTNKPSNANKVYVEVEFSYDPIWDYSKSSAYLDKTTSTAGSSSDQIAVKIIPGKYDSHITHKLTYYVLDPTKTDGSHLKVNGASTDKTYTILYPTKTHNFTVPMNWCYAVPNSISGTGYVTVETIYTYDSGNVSSLGKSAPMIFVFNVPDTIKPSVTSLNLVPMPTYVPNSNMEMVNNKSRQWVNANLYVQNYCGLKLEAAASGSYGSRITHYAFSEDAYRSWSNVFYANNYETNCSVRQNAIKTSGHLTYSVYVRDSRNRVSELKYKDIYVAPYNLPSFESIRTNRVNDEEDIAENGKYINVEAIASHTYVANGDDDEAAVDQNPILITFRYRKKSDGDESVQPWIRENIQIVSGQSFTLIDEHSHDDEVDPAYQYEIQFVVNDAMTAGLTSDAQSYYNNVALPAYQQSGGTAPPLPKDYGVYSPIVLLGFNQCTVFFKRDGLGIGIGQKTQTSRHTRALEIAPDWLIMHGQDDQNIYFVPDVVFTSAADRHTPKRKIGRIWLKEIG